MDAPDTKEIMAEVEGLMSELKAQRGDGVAHRPFEPARLGGQAPGTAHDMVQEHRLGDRAMQGAEFSEFIELARGEFLEARAEGLAARVQGLAEMALGGGRPVGTRLGHAARADGEQLQVRRDDQQGGRRGQCACPPAGGGLVAAGVVAWLAFQTFENIGMNLGIMPITGVPLPFVSYGGTSMFASWIALGLLQNVRLHQQQQL